MFPFRDGHAGSKGGMGHSAGIALTNEPRRHECIPQKDVGGYFSIDGYNEVSTDCSAHQ